MYANWEFARIQGMGWGWAGVIWLYSLVTYIPLDILKIAIRYIQSGKAWNNILENKVDFLFIFALSFGHVDKDEPWRNSKVVHMFKYWK